MINHIKTTECNCSQSIQCFHCGEPVIDSGKFSIDIDGKRQEMCSAECQSIAQTVSDSELSGYYRFRDENITQKPLSTTSTKNEIYDRPKIRSRYARPVDNETDEITLMLDGLTCAACAWLIENKLKKQLGIQNIDVNYANMTAKVRWNKTQITISQILSEIQKIGYSAIPYEPRIQYQQLLKQRNQQLKRIGITAVLGMQIMILSVALYFGYYTGIEENWESLFHKLGLLFTLPIILYSALPFFKASANQLKNLQPGMDVPVCLGLVLAFSASIWTIVSGKGEVYFDSITMFVLLLLVARYFMNSSILSASHSIERLATSTPLSASRLIQHSISSLAESITAEELKLGDWIRVLAGHVIPADGIIINGDSSVNQAVISGESKAIKVSKDSNVIAGSINNDSPLIIKVTASGENTVYSAIEQMAKQSFENGPSDLPLIDFIARWFVIGVLFIATLVAIYWWNTAPERWLSITIAVLVISCPCALSLSVPTANAATTSKLISQGLLLTNTTTIENLTNISHVLLDKTGTLTSDKLHLERINTFSNLEKLDVLKIAASMEVNSDHPLAKAISAKHDAKLYPVRQWENHTGLGINAIIKTDKFFLGSAEFIQKSTGINISDNDAESVAYLASDKILLAEFEFSLSLRQGVVEFLNYIREVDKPIIMLTGDTDSAAKRLAHTLDIEQIFSECKPEDKLEIVKQLQQTQSAKVLMIGDGINDSPVLAAANVSIAVAGATPLAVSGADIVMVNPSLLAVKELHQSALKTVKIIRQNISWAIGYNLLAIPFAASGMINPLFAAIGMSLSSIIVVLNAQRLRKI